MKKINLILFLLALSFQACTQQTEITKFTGKTWHLVKEEMNGIGAHIPLPGNTTLTINNDHSWSCSSAIDGYKNGTWVEKSNGKLKLNIREDNSAIISITREGQLKMIQKRLFAGKTFYWALQ